MRSILLVFVFLGLAACQDILNNPSYMPAGYTYHNRLYKAPPGPPPADIAAIYNESRNSQIVEGWNAAVSDLISQAEYQGLSAQPVYIEAVPGYDGFATNFDFTLREELRKRGYMLENNPAAAVPHVRYDAYLPIANEAEIMPVAREYEDFILVLTVSQGGRQQAQVSGVYRLPAYGYNVADESAPVADLYMGGM